MDKKILIVDDDIDTLQLVGTMLEKQGFKILAANNGEKAIRMADAQKPDLIILDVMMPGMDGYEVTRRLRALDSTAFIPIIMFTAKAQVDDKVEGFESGADDYLTKPTHPAELIAKVNSILTRPKTEGLIEPGKADQRARGKVIGVIAAKGGVGVSTLALNLAVCIHNSAKEYVTLVDLRPGEGTIGLQLGYTQSEALTNLLKMKAAEIRPEEIENQLITHGSGILLLLASFSPANSIFQRASDNFAAITKQAARVAPYTILDLGTGLNDANQKTIAECDTIIVVVEPIPTTIIQTREMIANLKDLGVKPENIQVVLINRNRLEITVPLNKVQEGVGQPILGVIVPAPEIAYQALTRHEPIVLYQPGSIVASQIAKLAESFIVTTEE
jgi:CheY-like chemotaxis protein/MinD-like ATPase involved in chromosome partitioning or flagellar assembly